MGDKFYVVTIQNFLDQEMPSAKSIFEYETRNEAYAAYFYTLSSSVSNPEIDSVYCEMVNKNGGIADRKFVQVTEHPEPDEEEG